MRLIDADKLKELIAVENNDVMATRKLVTALFEDIETVKAIPIEWIVNWLTRQHIPATHTCDDYYAVEMMLDDWEQRKRQQ